MSVKMSVDDGYAASCEDDSVNELNGSESGREDEGVSVSKNEGVSGGSSWLRTRRKMHVMRILQDWNLQFSGDESASLTEFVPRLEECMRCMELRDIEVLEVLPCILSGSASRWFRLCRPEIKCWSEFRLAFRNRFFRNLSNENLREDLKRRTQGEDESISEFLECFRLIVEQFLKPPSERAQVRQALRNLQPEYRHYMEERSVTSLKVLEEFGRKLERRKELDQRYKPPPSREAMNIPEAAPKSRLKEPSVVGSSVCDSDGSGSSSNGSSCSSCDSSSSSSSCSSNSEMEADLDDSGFHDEMKITESNVLGNECVVDPPKKRRRRRRRKKEMNVTLCESDVVECTVLEFAGPGHQSRAESRIQRPFVLGPCFVCNCVGHRAAECPQRVCRACLGMGHYAAECPERVAVQTKQSCQGCGSVGSSFWSCVNCKTRVNEYFSTGVWK